MGLVFTAFLDLLDRRFGEAATERLIDRCALASGAAYTAVGDYDPGELATLAKAAQEETGVAPSDLLRDLGPLLLGHLTRSHPQAFTEARDLFELLEQLDERIAFEVEKIHPGATPPRFSPRRLDARRMALTYQSVRPFQDLAEGLLVACAGHYGQTIAVRRESLADSLGVRFLITLEAPGG